MTNEERAFLALLAIGVFSVDAEGRIWRHRRMIGGSRAGAPSYWRDLEESTRAETSSSGERRENSTTYLRVMFTTGEGCERLSIDAHRIVWMVRMQQDIPSALEVNHKNGNGEDNRPDNLEIVTGSGNVRHAMAVLGKMDRKGSKNSGAKLTEVQVLEIRGLCDSKAMAQTEVARRYGVSTRAIQQIATRETWAHLADSTG
jgi:hypothetical protein